MVACSGWMSMAKDRVFWRDLFNATVASLSVFTFSKVKPRHGCAITPNVTSPSEIAEYQSIPATLYYFLATVFLVALVIFLSIYYFL